MSDCCIYHLTNLNKLFRHFSIGKTDHSYIVLLQIKGTLVVISQPFLCIMLGTIHLHHQPRGMTIEIRNKRP